MKLEISWLKGFHFSSITCVWTKPFLASDRGRCYLWAYVIRDNDVATASFLLCLRHWHAPDRRWRNGCNEGKQGRHFQSYSFSTLLPSLHSQRSWEAHPSHFPPLPRPFLYLRSSCTHVLSDQQNWDFPALLSVVLSHVFTSYRTQHGGYAEVHIQIPFFLQKWNIFHKAIKPLSSL